MKIILLLLISLQGYTQTFNYSKRILHLYNKDLQITKYDTFNLRGSYLKIKLDSAGKKVYIPGLDTLVIKNIKNEDDVKIINCKKRIVCTYWGPWLYVKYPCKKHICRFYDFILIHRQKSVSDGY